MYSNTIAMETFLYLPVRSTSCNASVCMVKKNKKQKKNKNKKTRGIYGSGDVLLNAQSGVMWWPIAQLGH